MINRWPVAARHRRLMAYPPEVKTSSRPWPWGRCRVARADSLYGVAVAGEAGTARALDLLAEELRRTLNLGWAAPDIDDLSAEWLTFNMRPAAVRAYWSIGVPMR